MGVGVFREIVGKLRDAHVNVHEMEDYAENRTRCILDLEIYR
jgi:hypothetical protein